jgi:hypothetical protein
VYSVSTWLELADAIGEYEGSNRQLLEWVVDEPDAIHLSSQRFLQRWITARQQMDKIDPTLGTADWYLAVLEAERRRKAGLPTPNEEETHRLPAEIRLLILAAYADRDGREATLDSVSTEALPEGWARDILAFRIAEASGRSRDADAIRGRQLDRGRDRLRDWLCRWIVYWSFLGSGVGLAIVLNRKAVPSGGQIACVRAPREALGGFLIVLMVVACTSWAVRFLPSLANGYGGATPVQWTVER